MKNKHCFWIILSVCLIIIVYTILELIFAWLSENKGMHTFNAAAILILTVILIIVAWYQLEGLNTTSKANFLLKIDERWGSSEIITARTIIHRLYREVRKEVACSCEEELIKGVANKIRIIGRSSKKDDVSDFILLLNFLDFLETITYFANQNYISKIDIDELSGESIFFYYKVFKSWINYRREKYNNSHYYEALKTFIENKTKN